MALRSLFTQVVLRCGMALFAGMSVFWLDGSLYEEPAASA